MVWWGLVTTHTPPPTTTPPPPHALLPTLHPTRSADFAAGQQYTFDAEQGEQQQPEFFDVSGRAAAR